MCAEYLTSSWGLTEMLQTLRPITAQCSPNYITLCYVNDTMTLTTCWAPCDRMWQTLQCHFAAQCSTNCITHVNDTTHGRYHTRLGCHTSSWSGFLIFRPYMLCAVFLFCCCLSVQKLDLSTEVWFAFYVSEQFQFAWYGYSFWGMSGLHLIDYSCVRLWPLTILA